MEAALSLKRTVRAKVASRLSVPLTTAQPLLLFRVYCTTSRHVMEPRCFPLPLSPSFPPPLSPSLSPPHLRHFFLSPFSSSPSLRLQRPGSPPPRRLYSAARRRLLWRRWGLQTAETLTPASFQMPGRRGEKKCSGAAMDGWGWGDCACSIWMGRERERGRWGWGGRRRIAP